MTSALDRQKLTWIRRLQRRLSAVTSGSATPLSSPFRPLTAMRAPDSPSSRRLPFTQVKRRAGIVTLPTPRAKNCHLSPCGFRSISDRRPIFKVKLVDQTTEVRQLLVHFTPLDTSRWHYLLMTHNVLTLTRPGFRHSEHLNFDSSLLPRSVRPHPTQRKPFSVLL
jgi:hypothetical protein